MEKKAVLYARVSSKEQEQEGFSIPAQLKLLKEFAAKSGFEIVREFVDVETAKKAGRAAFGEMVGFLKENPSVRTLLCEKTDRLYRNFKDYVTIDDLGVEIQLIREGETISKDSRSHVKFIHGIKVLMAKNYIDNLSEEVRKGHAEKAAQGEYPSIAPLGYRNNLQTHLLEIDEEDAPKIRRLFELYAAGRHSLRQLRELAGEAGLSGRRSKRQLSKSEVERILKNPIYYGIFRWKGKLWPGTHPTIISKELFDRVQEVFHNQNRSKKSRHVFAYGNLMNCSRCGCRITAERQKGKYVYYRCTGFRGRCGQPYVPERALEPKMRELVQAVLIGDEKLEWLKGLLRESHTDEKAFHDGQIKALVGRYEQLQQRLDQIYLDKLDGKIPAEFWEQKNSEWRQEQTEVQAKIERHGKANQNYMEEGIKILELAQQAGTLYVAALPEEKREILGFLLLNCNLADTTPMPTYRKPFNWLAEIGQMKEWRGRRDSNPRSSD